MVVALKVKTNANNMNASDFRAHVASEVNKFIKGHNNNRTMFQVLTVQVYEHIEKHGDHTVIHELYRGALAMSGNLKAKWLAHVQKYTHLDFNPKGIRGKALEEPKNFNALFVKNKGKKMNVEEARANNWWLASYRAGTDDGTVNVTDKVQRFFKGIQKAIEDDKAVDAMAKRMTYAAIIDTLKAEIDKLKPATESAVPVKVPAKRTINAVKADKPTTKAA
jgi:hypothetical protein